MQNDNSLSPDGQDLAGGVRAASAEIDRLAREEIAPAAALIDEAFKTAARSIERELGQAAKAGSLSLKSLSQSLFNDLRKTAINGLVRKPLQNLLTNAFAAPFGGARAAGGFVAPGASFLVGERGPEVFTPASSGAVSPQGAAPVNVSISLPGVTSPESFAASETQIAAGLARVLSRSRRNE